MTATTIRSAVAQIKTLTDCCDFIGRWIGRDAKLPLALEPDLVLMPPAIVELSNRLGQLWHSDAHAGFCDVLNSPTHPLTLLEYQDQIVCPHDYATVDGIIPFVVENQGVWQFGFDPLDLDSVYVSGDWALKGVWINDGWTRLSATVTDVLIFALLGNLCLMQAGEDSWDFDNPDNPIPMSQRTLLWMHPDWGAFEGFFTDTSERTLHYSNANLTIRG